MTQDNNSRIDRRTVLEGLGVAGIAGLAGCTGGGGDGGDGGDTGGGDSGSGGGDTGSSGGGDGGDGGGSETQNLVVASGGEGGVGHNSMVAIQSMLDERSDLLDITAQTSAGWAANLRLYDEGQVDMTTMDIYNMVNALNDEETYSESPVDNVQYQGLTITTIHIYTLVREDTDIQSYSDLPGKNIWPLGPAFGTRQPTEAFFKEAGLWDQMEVHNLPSSDIGGALAEGRIDAVVVYGSNFSALTGTMREIESRADLRVIPMDDEYVEVLEGMDKAGHAVIEPYGWDQDIRADELPNGEVDTWTFEGQIAFGTHIPEDLAYEFVQKTYEHNQDVRDVYSSFPNLTDNPERGVSSILDVQPVHPGAARFYQEEGLWNDAWEAGTVE